MVCLGGNVQAKIVERFGYMLLGMLCHTPWHPPKNCQPIIPISFYITSIISYSYSYSLAFIFETDLSTALQQPFSMTVQNDKNATAYIHIPKGGIKETKGGEWTVTSKETSKKEESTCAVYCFFLRSLFFSHPPFSLLLLSSLLLIVSYSFIPLALFLLLSSLFCASWYE